MPSYDPERTITTWAGILFQGVMDSEFLNAEHQEDAVSLHVGAQGFATFVENSNKSGIVTVTLAQTSITNAQLTAAFLARLKGPLLIEELDTAASASAAEVRIQKMPALKRGKDLSGVEWKLLVPKLLITQGGSL